MVRGFNKKHSRKDNYFMSTLNNQNDVLTTDGMLAMSTEYFKRLAYTDFDMYCEDKGGPLSQKEFAFFEEIKSQERLTGIKCEGNSTYYTVIGRAKEANICLELGLYGAALTTAITLPDTCGLIMRCKNEKGNVKNRYEEWFNRYVLTNNTQICNELKEADFTGAKCYQLRNKILHQNTIIKYKDNCEFKLTLSDTISKIGNKDKMVITIGIPFLCEAILEGIANFVRLDYPSPLDYKTYGFQVFSTIANIEAKKNKTNYERNKV